MINYFIAAVIILMIVSNIQVMKLYYYRDFKTIKKFIATNTTINILVIIIAIYILLNFS